jgi:hypothetical protein
MGCSFILKVGVKKSIVNAPLVRLQSKNTNNAKSEVILGVQRKSWAGKVLEVVDCFAFLKCKLTVVISMLTNQFINKISFFAMFYTKNKQYVPIKQTNLILVKRREIQTLHCSKWLTFSTPSQPRFSFEGMIFKQVIRDL